jgi:hypothetical protein
MKCLHVGSQLLLNIEFWKWKKVISMQYFKEPRNKIMHKLSPYVIKFSIRGLMFLTLLTTIILIIDSPLKSYGGNSAIDFYSPDSPPPGLQSLESLVADWWNWWENHSPDIASHWSECIKGDGGTIGNNQSIVFLPNVAFAAEDNPNSKTQKCQISSNQLLYLTVYPGECSTGSKPDEGEFPDKKNPADLLACAQDSNKVMKKMEVKVDGKDVSSKIVRQTTSKPFNFIVHQDNADDWKPPTIPTNTSMAENYYLFFKPLPVGDHTIELQVIRQPLQPMQPVENHKVKWQIAVRP